MIEERNSSFHRKCTRVAPVVDSNRGAGALTRCPSADTSVSRIVLLSEHACERAFMCVLDSKDYF